MGGLDPNFLLGVFAADKIAQQVASVYCLE